MARVNEDGDVIDILVNRNGIGKPPATLPEVLKSQGSVRDG